MSPTPHPPYHPFIHTQLLPAFPSAASPRTLVQSLAEGTCTVTRLESKVPKERRRDVISMGLSDSFALVQHRCVRLTDVVLLFVVSGAVTKPFFLLMIGSPRQLGYHQV